MIPSAVVDVELLPVSVAVAVVGPDTESFGDMMNTRASRRRRMNGVLFPQRVMRAIEEI